MVTESEGSVSRWIGDLAGGGDTEAAAQQLWERYFERLVHLAHARLRAAPRGPADEEDAALSAFHSFCQGAAAGRYPQLRDRDDLWRLLVALTARKVIDHTRRERRHRRGGGQVVGEATLGGSDPGAGVGLDQLAGEGPTPDFAALVADECRQRLAGLRDEALRRIALRRMEGYSNEQIAAQMGCSRRSVQRKLRLIRKAWLREGSP
ncbi:MAG: RNA polymerase subunit sigma-70 [Singulisphaera sp.]|nr:RNA polymerase subunit sigma-70 [Singulisphaera sp.]